MNLFLPGFVDDSVPAVRDGLVVFRDKVGDLYDNLIDWNRSYPIAFYVFLAFVILALISFAVHQDKRKRRWSKPIAIPRSGVDGMSPRREEVVITDHPAPARRSARSSQTPRPPTDAERKLPTRSTDPLLDALIALFAGTLAAHGRAGAFVVDRFGGQ